MRKILCGTVLMLIALAGHSQDIAPASIEDTTLVSTAKKDEISFVQDSLEAKYDLPYNLEYVPAEETPVVLADRLSCIQKTIPLTYNDKVDAFINYFTIRDRDFTRMALRRKNLYFPIFEKYLKKYNMPDELKYLSVIESGLNPKAISRARAAGLWQFMSGTGKYFGLKHDWYLDERMDPEKSTDAACRYLGQLYAIFGDWELALAAYNSGPGTVRKAIKRAGYKNTFTEIYNFLPRETRSYVPQYVAAVYALNYAEEHNITVDDSESLPAYDTLEITHYLHFETFAKLTNTCLDDLQKLNPSIQRNAIPDGNMYAFKVPLHAKEMMASQRSKILDSSSKVGRAELQQLAQKSSGSTYGRELTTYRVKGGDGLGAIAQRYGVRIADVRTWNNLHSDLIHPGQLINIWSLPSGKITASASAKISPPSADGKSYIVQPGDTLWEISKKFEGLTIDRIKVLNNLKSNKLQPGQKLIVG